MTPYAAPPHRASDESLFADVVTRAFGKRRKTLRKLEGLLEAGELNSWESSRRERRDLGGHGIVRIANYLEARSR